MPAIIGQQNGGGSSTVSTKANNYLFFGGNSSPFLKWYREDNGVFTELASPTPLPSGTVRGVRVNPAGTRLLVAFDTAPYVRMYNINANDTLTASAITFSFSGDGECVSFSPDGNFIAVGLEVSPYLVVYRINGDNTLTSCAIGSTPTTKVNAAEWSPDGLCLAVGQTVVNSGESLQMYTRVSTTDTSFSVRTLSNKSTVADTRGATWLNNNIVVYSSVSSDEGTFIQAFSRSGTVFTRIESNLNANPTNNCRKIASYHGGGLFSVGMTGAPYVQQYTNNNGYLTKVTDNTTQNTAGNILNPVLAGTVTHLSYSRDNKYLALSDGANGCRIYSATYPIHGLVKTLTGLGTVTDVCWLPKAEDY